MIVRAPRSKHMSSSASITCSHTRTRTTVNVEPPGPYHLPPASAQPLPLCALDDHRRHRHRHQHHRHHHTVTITIIVITDVFPGILGGWLNGPARHRPRASSPRTQQQAEGCGAHEQLPARSRALFQLHALASSRHSARLACVPARHQSRPSGLAEPHATAVRPAWERMSPAGTTCARRSTHRRSRSRSPVHATARHGTARQGAALRPA